MAITVNTLKAKDTDVSIVGANLGFEITKSDDNYLLDPGVSPDKQVVTKAISFDIASEAIKVEFVDGRTATIPAGALAAGVMHPMRIVKVWSTGTGGTVKVWAWL